MTVSVREDILVSVGFSEVPEPAVALEALATLGATLSNAFRYWEILVVVETGESSEYDELIGVVPNIRILKILPNSNSYRRRVSVASEAIGDVVVLTTTQELMGLDVIGMITKAYAEGCAVVGQWPKGRFLEPLLSALGHSSGFHVSSRDMQSAAFPRTILNRLLAHPNQQLALRFMPRDESLKVRRELWTAQPGTESVRSGDNRAFRRRVGVIMQLLTDAAPRILGYSALMSALMVLGGLFYAIYAIVVWLSFAEVEPGWFTISMGLSAAITFIGVVFFGICTGLGKILNVLTFQATNDVIDERSAVDLFGKLSQELNIENESAAAGRIANAPVKLFAANVVEEADDKHSQD